MKKIILTFIIALISSAGFSQQLFPIFGDTLTMEQKQDIVSKIKSDPLWSLIQSNEKEYVRQLKFAERFMKFQNLQLPSTWNDKKDFVTHLKEAGFVNAEQLEANIKFGQELMGILNRKYPDLIKFQQKDWVTLF